MQEAKDQLVQQKVRHFNLIDLANKCGCNISSILQYYPNKEKIIEEICYDFYKEGCHKVAHIAFHDDIRQQDKLANYIYAIETFFNINLHCKLFAFMHSEMDSLIKVPALKFFDCIYFYEGWQTPLFYVLSLFCDTKLANIIAQESIIKLRKASVLGVKEFKKTLLNMIELWLSMIKPMPILL